MRTLTEEQKVALIAMNEKIAKEETKAIKRYEMLQKELDQMVANQTIWGYNIDFKIGCFTFNEALNKKYNTEEGDPVYECRVASYRAYTDRKEHPEWNEIHYLRGTILEGFRFCYTFYCILSYSNLSIEEILLIQAVWIEIPVDYQWEVELIKTPE